MFRDLLKEENQCFQTCANAELNGIELFVGNGSVLELHKIGVKTIVNCANEKLEHGGGIAADIAARAGPELVKECREFISRFRLLRKKQVISTTAGFMPFKSILHVAGPVVTHLRPDQMEELQSCVFNCIQKASDEGLDSIGIPGISCGIFGFPKAEAAICHINGFIQYASQQNNEKNVKKVYLTLFTSVELTTFVERFKVVMEENVFDYARILDLPELRVNCFKKVCGGCKLLMPMDDFSFSKCHKVYCNYCIYRYDISYCFTCDDFFCLPFEYPYNSTNPLFLDPNGYYCRKCEKVVNQDPRNCKRCKNCCYVHFREPTDPCGFCGN